MDPISLTASVITIAGVGRGAYKLGKNFADAQDEIKHMLNDRQVIRGTLERLRVVIEALPSELAVLLNSWHILEDYTEKVADALRQIDHLLSELGLSLDYVDAGLWKRVSANFKWTVRSKRKMKGVMSHLSILKEVLLTDCVTSTLEDLIEQWLRSRRQNEGLERRIQYCREELEFRVRAGTGLMSDAPSLSDKLDDDTFDHSNFSSASGAVQRAQRAFRRVDAVLINRPTDSAMRLYFQQSITPRPLQRSYTEIVRSSGNGLFGVSQYPQQQHTPLVPLTSTSNHILEWLFQEESEAPSDIAPSSSVSWPSSVSTVSIVLS